MRFEAIVVGLGSMGASAAYHLARRGVRVLGLDRFDPPHERGAHSGGSRILRMAYMEGAEYVPLVRHSYEQWRALEAESGRSLLLTTGGLMLGRPDAVAVAGALASAREHGLTHELLGPAQIRKKYPAFTPAADEVALFEADAGMLLPDRAIAAYLRLAQGHGADLRTEVAVLDWQAGESGVEVETAAGTFSADRLVLTPGAWAPELTRLDVPMRVQRRIQHYWEPADRRPFARGRFPVWIWEYEKGLAAYGLPAMEGLVKAALHHGTEAVDPDRGAEPARDEEVTAMRKWLSTHLPGLADAEEAESAPCLYTLTPDEHFVVGIHPKHPQASVACGFSGHGFKFVPVVGEILADLAQHGSTRHAISLFDPARDRTPKVSA